MTSLNKHTGFGGSLKSVEGIFSVIFLIFLTGSVGAAGAAGAATPDPVRGKLLYENHCSGCHESLVHIRENHKARSFHDIRIQSMRWSLNIGLEWQGSEINDVSWYLYNEYYVKE